MPSGQVLTTFIQSDAVFVEDSGKQPPLSQFHPFPFTQVPKLQYCTVVVLQAASLGTILPFSQQSSVGFGWQLPGE